MLMQDRHEVLSPTSLRDQALLPSPPITMILLPSRVALQPPYNTVQQDCRLILTTPQTELSLHFKNLKSWSQNSPDTTTMTARQEHAVHLLDKHVRLIAKRCDVCPSFFQYLTVPRCSPYAMHTGFQEHQVYHGLYTAAAWGLAGAHVGQAHSMRHHVCGLISKHCKTVKSS